MDREGLLMREVYHARAECLMLGILEVIGGWMPVIQVLISQKEDTVTLLYEIIIWPHQL